MSRMFPMTISVVLVLTLSASSIAAEGADHPLVGRFEDSEIVDYEQSPFDEYLVLDRKVAGDAEWGDAEKAAYARTVEGKVTRITYESPKERTTLEVMRAYEEALKEGGFELLFQCSDDACGGRDFNHAVVPYDLLFSENHKDQRYIAARKARPGGGDVYAAIYTVKAYSVGGDRKNRVYTQVDVIEERPRETEVVVVKADEMARQIGDSGSVALYGIYFDHDEARVKPGSAPTLEEIAKLLRREPGLELLVVGHTDNEGGFAYNKELSARRAVAVVEALVDEHGVARDRLEPYGVAFLAPVASNDTEEGRAENRRVELVER